MPQEQQPALDTAAVDPVEFARHIASTSDNDLATAMRSEGRSLVLDEVFARMERHFLADRARGVEAIIHWRIGDRPDGGHDVYEVVIREGACRLSEQPLADPGLTFTVGAVDFLRLVTGGRQGPMMFMRGRLKVVGDLPLAARMTSLFSIPSA
ncbi:MAG: SCP2 sterol-binding domain-containing protein [Solirubrobacteraceae bacterium]